MMNIGSCFFVFRRESFVVRLAERFKFGDLKMDHACIPLSWVDRIESILFLERVSGCADGLVTHFLQNLFDKGFTIPAF